MIEKPENQSLKLPSKVITIELLGAVDYMLGKKLREIDIRPGDRIVHIHVPKTFGTTFNAILESLVWGSHRCPEWHLLKLVDVGVEKVRQYQFFIGHFEYSLFSEIIFPKGFIGLTFLRDPVICTVSFLSLSGNNLIRENSMIMIQG